MDPSHERAQQRSPFLSPADQSQSTTLTVRGPQSPRVQTSAPSPGDPMDTSPPGTDMGPPQGQGSMETDTNGTHEQVGMGDQPNTGSLAGPNAAAAAAAAGTPKVVQTAFIHKLYNMLEDQTIQHLISWAPSHESFLMSPSSDFSRVLSQYFKHTNISSFVRQLNMYGFHKVSDVFHTGSPETPLWEFKHGMGNFKKGDLIGLREIKRRASRHALVHRDSYSTPKPPPSQPGTPAEPMAMQPMPESTESRMASLEWNISELRNRLQRSESESQSRDKFLMDALARSFQLNYDMSKVVLSLLPEGSPYIRDMMHIQAEIARQEEAMRTEPEPEPPFSSSRPYFSNLSLNPAPVSPRQVPHDDPRRMQMGGPPPHNNFHRPPMPPHLNLTPRRYGSIGANTSQSSPSSLRSQVPPPPSHPPTHPLATSISSPPGNLARRHTSADIHSAQGWQSNASPFASGQSSTQWPSSPKRSLGTMNEEQQRIRESFSSYSLQSASSSGGRNDGSRPTSPPPFSNGNLTVDQNNLNTWSWGSQNRSGSSFKDNSGPPTRRGSMAHILNPAETAEREEEHEEELREDDRKRKRLHV